MPDTAAQSSAWSGVSPTRSGHIRRRSGSGSSRTAYANSRRDIGLASLNTTIEEKEDECLSSASTSTSSRRRRSWEEVETQVSSSSEDCAEYTHVNSVQCAPTTTAHHESTISTSPSLTFSHTSTLSSSTFDSSHYFSPPRKQVVQSIGSKHVEDFPSFAKRSSGASKRPTSKYLSQPSYWTSHSASGNESEGESYDVDLSDRPPAPLPSRWTPTFGRSLFTIGQASSATHKRNLSLTTVCPPVTHTPSPVSATSLEEVKEGSTLSARALGKRRQEDCICGTDAESRVQDRHGCSVRYPR